MRLLSSTSLVLLTILLPATLFAQVELSGNLNGVLTAQTYLVTDSIFVQEGDGLLIHAGAEFLFDGEYAFVVYGILIADGAVEDSITFQASTRDGTWHGIDFRGIPSRHSRLSYCVITQSQTSAIFCLESSPTIEHCSLVQNINVDFRGGGVFCYEGASPHIENCTISNNFGLLDGGGIGLMGECNATILNCTITDNITEFGAGIYVNGCSDVVIRDCVITGNISHYFGGGIYLYASTVEVTRCLIADNYTDRQGGGMHCRHTDVQVDHVVLSRNEAVEEGAGVYIGLDVNLSMVNSIVANHENGGFYSDSEFTPELTYTDFFENENYTVAGNLPGGFGEITDVNVNGDSCDVYANLFLDPGFIHDEGMDYRLMPYSPCIDAGDPDSEADPDGSITEMGVYRYYDFPPELVFSDTLLNFGSVYFGNSSVVRLYVENVGGGFGWIDSVGFNDDDGLTVLNEEFPIWIHPDTYIQLLVEWTPDTLGLFETMMYVHHNDSSHVNPFPVLLTGNAEVDVDEEFEPSLPQQVILYQNAPNPFNQSTVIRFELPYDNRIRLSVFDLLGREVAVLRDGIFSAGTHEVVFDDSGLASGMYVCRLQTAGAVYQQRMVLVR